MDRKKILRIISYMMVWKIRIHDNNEALARKFISNIIKVFLKFYWCKKYNFINKGISPNINTKYRPLFGMDA